MPIGQHLGEALKFLRSRRQWPQKQLAAKAGVTRSMISGYEKGKSAPTLVTLTKIAQALEADLCDFHCALEHVEGRPMTVHELRDHFLPGPARPERAGSRQEAAAAGTAEDAPGAAGPSQGPLPEDLAGALDEAIAALRKLRRYAGQLR
jgi:transcriptional regulator with XRE-family HTH domain